MGAHVALTGLRGALAPFIGYWLLGILGYEGVAWFSVALVTFPLSFFTVYFRTKEQNYPVFNFLLHLMSCQLTMGIGLI